MSPRTPRWRGAGGKGQQAAGRGIPMRGCFATRVCGPSSIHTQSSPTRGGNVAQRQSPEGGGAAGKSRNIAAGGWNMSTTTEVTNETRHQGHETAGGCAAGQPHTGRPPTPTGKVWKGTYHSPSTVPAGARTAAGAKTSKDSSGSGEAGGAGGAGEMVVYLEEPPALFFFSGKSFRVEMVKGFKMVPPKMALTATAREEPVRLLIPAALVREMILEEVDDPRHPSQLPPPAGRSSTRRD